MGVKAIKTHTTLIAAFAAITAPLLSTPVQALDGEQLYTERTCIACHGAAGRLPIMEEYPKVSGQSKDYIVGQMKDIKSGARSNSHTAAMKNVMHLISDDEMNIVAEWLAGLPQ